MSEKKIFHHYDIAYRVIGEEQFHLVKTPDYGWTADPFLTYYKGDLYLFAEIFLYKSERNGVIGYAKWENDHFSDWTVTMDKHWHLSYPNVWCENDKLYMCPESYQLEEVAIYELEEFPNKWIKKKVLLDNVEYCDNTFLDIHDGFRYMFTFKRGQKSPEGTGLLYKFSDIDSPQFKVLSDSLRGTRCGGKICNIDGKNIRVGQDCVKEYGNALIFYAIDSVWPNYKEHEIKRIGIKDIKIENPAREYSGIHTYNRVDPIEVIDLRYASSTSEEMEASDRVHRVFVDKY